LKPIYFDCEFTSLEPGAKLISIGMARGEQALYIELIDGWATECCNDFVIEHVLPHLDHESHGMPAAVAALRIREWIESLGVPVQLATDAPAWDWPHIQELLCANWPGNLARQPMHVNTGNVEDEIDRYFSDTGAVRHHALNDAKALQHAAEIEHRYWSR